MSGPAGHPAWWSSGFPELIARREPMPNIEKWQALYIRYRKQVESHLCPTGWDLNSSRFNYEQSIRTELHHEDHPVLNGLAPEALHMQISEAPAEYAVPVKQDRRLAPNFKVRVEVKSRVKTSFPVTVKAYVVSQQEKDNILEWQPHDQMDRDQAVQRKPLTELKGTTCITHNFEAQPGLSMSHAQDRLGQTASMLQSFNTAGASSHSGLDLAKDRYGSSGASELGLDLPGSSDQQAAQQAAVRNALFPMQGSMHPALAGGGAPTFNPNTMFGSWNVEPDCSLIDHMLLQSRLSKQLPMYGAAPDFFLNHRMGELSGMGHSPYQLQLQGRQPPPQGPLTSMSHEFEFSNLEFLKPTRMNKVYIIFSCSILDIDTMYVVYTIPTIAICRAEQRIKACEKLGIAHQELSCIDHFYMRQVQPAQADGSGGLQQGGLPQHMDASTPASAGVAKRKVEETDASDSDHPSHLTAPTMRDTLALPSTARAPGHEMSGSAPPNSRAAVRDWILELYEDTGLTRKLTEMDIQALLSGAGFPQDASSESTACISPAQWEEFGHQYKSVLRLMSQISGVWNMEDPCVISGFDMDRVGTVQALASEPAGTFICRFSMSQPGCLVLSCKVTPGHPQADAQRLIHAILHIDDLTEKRIDSWIRDFVGATHVLDVYKHKRVDKRKVFASNYLRLRQLDPHPQIEGDHLHDVAM